MNNNWLTIAIVFATLMGPILAVLVTRLQDARTVLLQRQTDTFRTLMATRASPVSPEHVGAINTIEVDFHGVLPIETAYRDYIDHLNNGDADASGNPTPRWQEQRRDLLAVLLAKMATVVNRPKSEIEIRKGGYFPTAWTTRDNRQWTAQDWVLALAKGDRALPVKIIDQEKNQI